MKKILYNMNKFHILTGDLNAHNKGWSQGKSNKRGQLVVNWLKSNEYTTINRKKTHFNCQKKCLDFILKTISYNGLGGVYFWPAFLAIFLGVPDHLQTVLKKNQI